MQNRVPNIQNHLRIRCLIIVQIFTKCYSNIENKFSLIVAHANFSLIFFLFASLSLNLDFQDLFIFVLRLFGIIDAKEVLLLGGSC